MNTNHYIVVKLKKLYMQLSRRLYLFKKKEMLIRKNGSFETMDANNKLNCKINDYDT